MVLLPQQASLHLFPEMMIKILGELSEELLPLLSVLRIAGKYLVNIVTLAPPPSFKLMSTIPIQKDTVLR